MRCFQACPRADVSVARYLVTLRLTACNTPGAQACLPLPAMSVLCIRWYSASTMAKLMSSRPANAKVLAMMRMTRAG